MDHTWTAEDLAAASRTVERFVAAARAEDEATLKELLIIPPGQTPDYKSMRDSLGKYSLSPPVSEAEQVIVQLTMTPQPDGQTSEAGEPPVIPLVLVRPENAWRIDMGASIDRLLGFSLDNAMDTLAQGIGQAMEKAFDAVAGGLQSLSSPPQEDRSGEEPEQP